MRVTSKTVRNHNYTVEPRCNGTSFDNTLYIPSRRCVAPPNSSLLTVTSYPSNITKLVYTETKYSVSFLMSQPSSTVFVLFLTKGISQQSLLLWNFLFKLSSSEAFDNFMYCKTYIF